MRDAGPVRIGSVADLDAVMGLLDEGVAWLVEHGRTGQWGDQPWSASADRVARIRRMIEENELLLLDRDGVPVGFRRTEPFEVKGWPGQLLERRS